MLYKLCYQRPGLGMKNIVILSGHSLIPPLNYYETKSRRKKSEERGKVRQISSFSGRFIWGQLIN